MHDLSGLMEGLQSQRGLAVLLSDLATSVCPFWFNGNLVESEKAGCLAF